MRASRAVLFLAVSALIFVSGAISSPRTAVSTPGITNIVFAGTSLSGLPSPAEEFGPPSVHDNGKVTFEARGARSAASTRATAPARHRTWSSMAPASRHTAR